MTGPGVRRRRVLGSVALALAGAGVAGGGVLWRWTEADGESVPRTDATTPAPRTPTPSPTPDYLGAARSRVAAYLTETGGRITVAVQDRLTDLELAVGTRRFATASIVKVDILAAVLLRAQQRRRSISSADRQRARKMITISDNDSATALFGTAGGVDGLNTANRTFGLRETKPSVHWGMSTTTASDQIRLLTAITAEDGPLTAQNRELIFDLMSEVVEEQDWGITAAAGPQTTERYVKNGWVPIDADAGRWEVNSIGRLVEPGHDWLVAVLSDHHKTQAAGVQMVEKVAKYTLNQLRAVPPVTVP
ncbi:serine hydrolase [Micromonospora sp. NPDC049559]|uniref:serine hydrolase n=1 Tax=Micromonospora sp. NPDC049559 TaxID=3155923 RepID=UPI0034333DD8